MSEYLRWRPQIDMWTDLDDTTHPFVVFPDPCGPARILIDNKLIKHKLKYLETRKTKVNLS